MNKIRGGVAGLGKMGISHAAIIGAHDDVSLISVCDTSVLVIEAFKKFSSVNVYTDFKSMVNKEKLDFVIIATPTKYHYPMVKYALESDLHVFCEKPFSLIPDKDEELVLIANDKRLVNQVGYHNHFIGTFRELKRLLDCKIIGDIVHFNGEASGPVVVKEKIDTWRSKPNEGGGCLYDYASHVINLIQEVIGRPMQVYGTVLKKIYSKNVEDAVYSILRLENDLTGTLNVNWSDETYRKMSTCLTVYGKKGKIICDGSELKIYLKESCPSERLDAGWTIKYITELALPVNYYLRGEEYSAQLDYFIRCIKKRELTKYNSFEQAFYTDRVIEMIIKNSKVV